MLVPLTEINNCYILQKQLGQDSCAEHWLASAIYSPHRFLIRFVKDELAPPAFLEQFRLESMRYYSFEGKAFSDFIEIEYFKKRLFISSEYHGEETLTEKRLHDRTWNPELSSAAILNLASGIDRIHEHQMIFGSLTPENIEIVSGGKSDSDFRLRTPGYSSFYQTLPESQTENNAYRTFLAPELKSGAKPGRTADIYSLGVTLAWLLTGPLPVIDRSFPKNLDEELRKKQIPDGLSHIIYKAIQQEPPKRYQNCTNFMEAVTDFLKAFGKEREEEKKRLAPTPESTIAPIQTTPHAILPEAAPRHEVLTYFQEISADYFSAAGKYPTTKDQKTTSEQKPIPKASAPAVPAVPNPNADYFNRSSAKGESPASIVEPPQAFPTKDIDSGSINIIPEPPVNLPAPYTPSIAASVNQSSSEHPVTKAKSEKANIKPPRKGQVKTSTSQKASTTTPAWKYRRVALDDIESRLLGAVKRARNSRGAVHYLGESDFRETNKLVESLFADLHKESVYVDLGSFLRFGKAGVQDFLRALRVALAASVTTEKTYSLSRFARMVDHHGAKAFFGSEPLGRMLYGKDLDEHSVAESDWDGIIRAMAVFGRKKKPLVLMIRGGECFKPELIAFFNNAVPLLKDKPVCLFLFRKDFPAILRILGVMDPHY